MDCLFVKIPFSPTSLFRYGLVALLLITTGPGALYAQQEQFRGKPHLIEETTFATADNSVTFSLVYRFDENGRMKDEWRKDGTGNKSQKNFYTRHKIYEYRPDGQLMQTTENDAEDNLIEIQQWHYNPKGHLLRMVIISGKSGKKQELAIETDEKGRVIQQYAPSVTGSDKVDNWVLQYPSDSVVVKTLLDTDGKPRSVWAYHSNQWRNFTEISETNTKGDTVSKIRSDYRYDVQGNWVERSTSSVTDFHGKPTEFTFKATRRIVYYTEAVKKLESEHLHGTWTDFLQGIQLEFKTNGTYLATVNGKMKDGGYWTLDTRKKILSFTGKEHPEPQLMDYNFDGWVFLLYRPENKGVMRLVKLEGE